MFWKIWHQYPRIFQTSKVCAEVKTLKKNCHIWIILGWNFKKTLPCLWNRKSQNLSICKVSCKTKKTLISGCNLKKTNVTVEINFREFVKLQSLIPPKKLWAKKNLIRIFLGWNFNKLFLWLKLAPSNLSKTNF